MTKQDVLKECTVSGNTVYLPNVMLERSLYQDVAKSLNLIGGKWKGGKIAGFVFDENPTELLAKIQGGKNINLKKDYQFFATPDNLCDYLVDLAGIEEYDMILEPSAGQGAIIKAIQRRHNTDVHYCELMELNRTFLQRIPRTIPLTANFLVFAKSKHFHGTFHKIIANPPFSKNQDIDHIRAMYSLLHENGRIVTIASKHWQYASGKKESEFKKWIEQIGAIVEEIPAGSFKESGTNIATCLIIIDK